MLIQHNNQFEDIHPFKIHQFGKRLNFRYVFLDCEMTLANEIMDDFVRLGSAQG